jgi:hypothetical protein
MEIYRLMEAKGGYLWNRQQCYSRSDYFYVSGYLASKATKEKVKLSCKQSDHAYAELNDNEEIVMEQGLARVNAAVQPH